MDQGGNLADSLDSISKQHEREVVIELGTDRLIRLLGVYTLLFLAVVAKIGDLSSDSLVCHPATSNADASGEFISFATTYCWAHDQTTISSSSSCNVTLDSSDDILTDPANLKRFLKALPYLMFVQAFLFASPLAFWHFRVGARLVGHLKFMQLLLNEIFEKVKTVPMGKYKFKPYDATSSSLDGRTEWDNEEVKNPATSCLNRVTISCCGNGHGSPSENGEQMQMSAVPQTEDDKGEASGDDPQNKDVPPKLGFVERFVAGNMRDRNFFSMLCYENFASLHHLPYILSTFILAPFTPDKNAPKRKVIKAPLHETMIYLWCDKKNFDSTFLLKMYALKQLGTCLLALVMFSSLMMWFFCSVIDDVIVSETFGCEIPFQHECFLCAIKRVPDIVVLFSIDMLVTLTVMVLSLWKWMDVRSSDRKETAHFFDQLEKRNNVALQAATYVQLPPE